MEKYQPPEDNILSYDKCGISSVQKLAKILPKKRSDNRGTWFGLLFSEENLETNFQLLTEFLAGGVAYAHISGWVD